MRKLIALMLILALVFGVMSTAMAKKATTLEIYWIGNADNEEIRAGVEEAINEYIEPLINAKVSFHIINWDDWTRDALQPLLDGEKIDLIFTADWRDYVQEITAGKLSPLDDLLESDGQGIRDTLPATFLEGVKYKGVIYGIPTNKELCVPTGVIVNKTAAALIGWDPDKDPVKTTAELEEYLARYREKFPGRYPYLMENGRWADEPWVPDWIGIEGNAVAMKMAKNEKGEFDETIYNIYETPEQEEHIRLMYKWAQAGYINPDAVNTTKSDGEVLFGKGDFLVYTMALKGNNIKGVELYTEKYQEGAEPFEVAEIIMQPKYIVTAHTAGSMFAIPKSSLINIDKAMEYLNLMLFGVEGVNYEKVDDLKVKLTDKPWYNRHGGAWTVGDVTLQLVLETEDPEKNPKLIEFAKDAVETCCLGFRFNKKKLKDETAAVNEAVKAYVNPLLCGAVDPDDPEKGIEAMKAALKEAGIDEIVKKAQKQYDDWKTAQQ